MINPSTLHARNVSIRIGERLLLNDITLSLAPGSMTVLLGPNGAGKTTLIRVLAGILPTTSGEVSLGPTPLRELGRSMVARHCAYLPQHLGSTFEMRVEDVVGLGRYPHLGTWGRLSSRDVERVDWALERVGMTAFRRRTLPTLSGGERQRVFLARALAQEAPILLLDEPISALDVGRQLELMALLTELHEDGHTILAVLHDLRPALDFFPRAILLREGHLTAEGSTRSVIFGQPLQDAFGVCVHVGEGLRFGPILEEGRGARPIN